MNFLGHLCRAAILLALAPCVAHAVLVDMVVVGNTGNVNDAPGFDSESFGSVSYQYQIGKYEVTNGQYAEFLNAVAGTDTNNLYHSSMGTDPRGGITRTCTSTCTYSTRVNMDDKPVNFVDFWDAARFANWMHNGQPTGPQGPGTTEGGTYTLTAAGITNNTVVRNSDATWFLPTEDEWYKAAYHKNDGDTGNYYEYPTGNDTAPTEATADGSGDITNPGTNIANYNRGADWNGQDGNVTTVGAAGAGSASAYGTFDQGGNVYEWNEVAVTSTSRGIMGGSWGHASTALAASTVHNRVTPEFQFSSVGFRLAAIPEPCQWLYGCVVCFGLLVWNLVCLACGSAPGGSTKDLGPGSE